ncbi:TIGR01440 family protein [Ureibacillus chungkukjangi]|uniref:TIGR01440 family protein n=1 Tax=Ureibacillus chungkukjangi TaxID=1202712 RepID=UPI00203DB09F|nr:TIGR01440 family protein [Ureibacillus chungkukjangi]MCM3390278.1 TIGR01440 family protein [Ureibacillus chungkukjangi]
MTSLQQIQSQLSQLLSELEQQVKFQPKQLYVIGCSTSEIAGSRIGTSGAIEIAEVLFDEFSKFAQKHSLYLVFQGCEHINRSLTMEAEAAQMYSLEPVTVVPVKHAGGSMSAYAYSKFENPVVVEHVRAHGGIDIGQTIIGMHLKEVAIPLRTSVRQIGEAIVTIATTRPKLIGGERAVYIR